MDKLLEGRTAIVTGGTGGIGRIIALTYAQHGAKVAIFGTNIKRGEQVVEEINRIYGSKDGIFVQLDISKTDEVNSGFQKVIEKFGKIDVLVNNAGITRDLLLLRMSEEDWDKVMEVNVKSCYNTSKAVARVMLKQKSGKIINISSVVGLSGNPGQTNYAASKAAMIGFTKALAKELASRNILINAIAPGYIETKMTNQMTEQQKDNIRKDIPLGRIGTPEEVANVALFLASYLSDYITGEVIVVDGGYII